MKNQGITKLLSEISPGLLHFSGARMALLDIESGFWEIRRQTEALVGNRLADFVLQQAGTSGGASFARSFNVENNKESADVFSACVQAYQSAGFGRFELIKMEWPIGNIQIRATDAFEAWIFQQRNEKAAEPKCAYTAGVFVGFVNIVGNREDVVCIEQTCQAKGDEACVFELIPAIEAKGETFVPFIPAQGIGTQLNLLEMLFEHMPMGIAILDRDYRLQRYNPTWANFAKRYAPPSGAPLSPGVGYFEHLPGSEPIVLPMFEQVLAGETVRREGQRLESEGIVTYWDIVLAPIFEEREIVGILNVAVDATERVTLQQTLEQRVKERTRELSTLLQVTHDINSTLELKSLLNLVLEQLKTVVNYSGSSILALEDDELVVRAYRGPIPKDKVQQLRFPLAGALVNSQVIQERAPIVIPDVLSDTPLARMFQQTAANESEATFGYIRSWLGVPLLVKDEVLGMLTLDHNLPDQFTAQHGDLVLAFANQAAVAIENARLFEKAEEVAISTERNRLARDLHDAVTQTLFSASMIADVLPRIWDRNPDEGRRRLEELRQLTRGALSEMRTLLVELRPAALVDTDLGDLIGHQVNAFIARTRIPVLFDRNCLHNPPLEVKEAFYRITQEAFNNIAKHAEATAVTVQLDCQPGKAVLIIQDNGIGFDLGLTPAEGLGVGIMHERALNAGAELEIHSKFRKGTQLRILWQEPDHKEHIDE